MREQASHSLGGLDLDLVRRIDAVCRRFEADYRAGRSPVIADYVGGIPEVGRSALLSELIGLEEELRRSDETSAQPDCRSVADAPTIAPASLPPEQITGLANPFVHDEATMASGDQATVGVGSCEPAPRNASAPVRVRYFGDYEIEGELARGGMGVVFRARQISLNRPVALKMILAGQLADETDVKRFYTEAEAAANLDHPGIVPIIEVGQYEGQHYFSMGFVEGESLAQRLSQGPLSCRQAAELMVAVCEAIDHAHRHGVIHRDLKPGNILLDAKGNPRVTDFGLAKKIEGDSGLTGSGQIMGTPSYMPPEQAGGQRASIGPAADVYALGATLYALITGRPPFQAATAVDTVIQVLNDDPVPPVRLNGSIPRDLETICLKCLQKEPEHRYLSAADLAADVRRFLNGEPIAARPVGFWERGVKWARRRPAMATLIAGINLLLVALLGLGVWSYAEIHRALGVAEARRRDAEQARMVAERAQTAAEDAQKRAESARDRENRALLETRRQVVNLDIGTGNRFMDDGDSDAALLWYVKAWQESPDPSDEPNHRLRIGLSLEQKPELVGLAVLDAPVADAESDDLGRRALTRTTTGNAAIWDLRAGRRIATLDPPGGVNAIAFSSGGDIAVTGSQDGIARVWDGASGTLKRTVAHGSPIRSVALRSDGRVLATAGGEKGVNLWDLKTGTPATPVLSSVGAYYIAFSADGQRLITASEDKLARVWETATGKPLTPPLPHEPPGDFELLWRTRCHPILSADGRTVITSTGSYNARNYEVTCWNADNGALNWKRAGGGNCQTFSEDGKQLLVCFRSAALLDAQTGGSLVNLPTPRECQKAAFWGAGRYVAASTGGLLRIWDTPERRPRLVASVQTTDSVRVLRGLPDGKHIFVAAADGTVRVYAVKQQDTSIDQALSSGQANRISIGRDHRSVTFSPDGTIECEYGDGEKTRLGSRGQSPLPIVLEDSGASAAAFGQDGRILVTMGTIQDGTVLRAWASDSGRPLGPLVHTPRASHWSRSADGRRVAVEQRERRSVEVFDMVTGKSLLVVAYPVPVDLTPGILELSRDGRVLVTGDFAYAGALEVWDIDSRRRLSRFFPVRGYLVGLCLAADASSVLVWGTDTTARLWDLRSGTPRGPLLRHSSYTRQGDLSGDGRRAITLGGGVHLWDPVSGERFGTWKVPIQGTIWLAKDDRRILVQENATCIALDISPFTAQAEGMAALAELLVGRQIDPASGGIDYLNLDRFTRDPDRYLKAYRDWRQGDEREVRAKRGE